MQYDPVVDTLRGEELPSPLLAHLRLPSRKVAETMQVLAFLAAGCVIGAAGVDLRADRLRGDTEIVKGRHARARSAWHRWVWVGALWVTSPVAGAGAVWLAVQRGWIS